MLNRLSSLITTEMCYYMSGFKSQSLHQIIISLFNCCRVTLSSMQCQEKIEKTHIIIIITVKMSLGCYII